MAMQKVKADVDRTFVNLPSAEQAKQLVANSDGIIGETKRLIEALANVSGVTELQIEEATQHVQQEGDFLDIYS